MSEETGPLTDEEDEHIAMQVHRNPNTARSFLVQRLLARIRTLEAAMKKVQHGA